MDKETLFKEIRRQQVLLWAGAGFSLYAGYPLGKGVVERLYQELSEAQRQKLASSLGQQKPECPSAMPLPEFAQRFVTLHYGNRERLIEVLTEIFSTTPITREVHEELAKIAYIDAIVTTNYDSLFELAYGSANLHVVTDADNVPQIGRKPITLYKIHGELNRPKTIIITKDDYQRFFEKADDLVWTHLRALMSARTIVFIGYAVEDSNVLDVFLGLIDRLGNLMRPAYVVGPGMDLLKIEELRQKNIHFIKASGKEFVDELLLDIKKKALIEIKEATPASVKSTSQTLNNLGINFDIRFDESGLNINNLERREGVTRRTISFSPKVPELNSALERLNSRKSLKAIKIDIEQLNHFTQTVEGFTLPNSNIASFWLALPPGIAEVVDIRFYSGLLVPDVKIFIYHAGNNSSIIALSSISRVEFFLSKDLKSTTGYNVRANLDSRSKVFANLAALLEHAYIMRCLDRSEGFDILKKGQIIWRSSEQIKAKANLKSSDNTQEGDFLISVVEMLPKVEQVFGISFQNLLLANQVLEEIVDLYHIITELPFTDKVDKKVKFLLEKDEPIIKSIQPGKSVSLKESFSIEGSYTGDFHVFGWHLRLSWREKELIIKPVCKRVGKGDNYELKSKVKQFVRECVMIESAEVVQAAEWHEPTVPSDEELFKERLPREFDIE